MIKVRLTYSDTQEGIRELTRAIKILDDNFVVLHQSNVYKGLETSKYNNIYLDIELKGKGE